MALAHEYRRELGSQRGLHRRQQIRLIVDHDVMRGRVAALHMIEHALLVHVDHHAALDRIPDAGALDLARLEYHVAVREDHRRPQGAQVRDRRECRFIDEPGEGVLQQKIRHLQQPRVIVQPRAEGLQACQVIGDPEPLAQLGKDAEIALARGRAEMQFEARSQVGREAIVVEQRIVDIEQEHGQHGDEASTCGSCQVAPSTMISALEGGPQLPGSYSVTGRSPLSKGSTTRHAASTLSSCVNSEVSPWMASPSSRSYGDFSPGTLCRAVSSTGSPCIPSPLCLTRAPSLITTSGLKRKRK